MLNYFKTIIKRNNIYGSKQTVMLGNYQKIKIQFKQ